MSKEQNELIDRGALCPYCLEPTYLTAGKFGNMLKCEPCRAWVSVDEKNIGRGRVANPHLQILRKRYQVLKRRVLTANWFKKKEFASMVFWRGGIQSENIYLMNESQLKNITKPLEEFVEIKQNNTWQSPATIKAMLKINYFDKGE